MRLQRNISKSNRLITVPAAIVIALLITSCADDNFNSAMRTEAFPFELVPSMRNTGVPVPGNGGIITAGAVSTDRVQLLWTAAVDGETPPESLEYSVYRSAENNISTPELAAANGDLVSDWTVDITSIVADGLAPGTAYYFNVIVRDTDGNKAAYNTIALATSNDYSYLPVPGNGGIITAGAVSTDRVQLLWTAAVDTETPPENLEYSVYRSAENNISTPELAAANGDLVSDWTADITSIVADGLAPGTAYYFNVIVRDTDNNEAAYNTIAITTTSNVVYLFSAGRYTGNLTTPATASARGDIDGICRSAKDRDYPRLPFLNVRAFISISNADYIAAMPLNFGVPQDRNIVSPAGSMIAENWPDILDGSINETLDAAGIANNFWWSGSDAYGIFTPSDSSVTGLTCRGWTVGTNASQGLDGATNRTDGQWMSEGISNCNNSLHLLCIGW